jgi:hypothetical protein
LRHRPDPSPARPGRPATGARLQGQRPKLPPRRCAEKELFSNKRCREPISATGVQVDEFCASIRSSVAKVYQVSGPATLKGTGSNEGETCVSENCWRPPGKRRSAT